MRVSFYKALTLVAIVANMSPQSVEAVQLSTESASFAIQGLNPQNVSSDQLKKITDKMEEGPELPKDGKKEGEAKKPLEPIPEVKEISEEAKKAMEEKKEKERQDKVLVMVK